MPRLTRRDVVVSVAAAPALFLPRSVRAAAAFPARSIQFIIPYGARAKLAAWQKTKRTAAPKRKVKKAA